MPRRGEPFATRLARYMLLALHSADELDPEGEDRTREGHARSIRIQIICSLVPGLKRSADESPRPRARAVGVTQPLDAPFVAAVDLDALCLDAVCFDAVLKTAPC